MAIDILSPRARRLGMYLKYRFASEEERSLAASHAEPNRVMAETAVLDFMRDLGG